MTPEERSEQKKRANEVEKRIADYLGGFKTPKSGAIPHLKGDVLLDDYLIDSKNTVKSSIDLKISDIEKCHKEGRDMSKLGHLVLTFYHDDYDWAAVSEKYTDLEDVEVFNILIKKQKKLTKSFFKSCETKARKKGKTACVRATFEYAKLGVPRVWMIIPLKYYKEKVL